MNHPLLVMITIRKYEKKDRNAVIDVCYHTGYMGDDCEVKGKERNHFNSLRQEKLFLQKMGFKILFHLLFITFLRHVRDFFTVMGFIVMGVKSLSVPPNPRNMKHEDIVRKYPAHLHIDILEGYQRQGIGSRLINAFLEHVKKSGVKGVHLGTSTKNYKAVPFYLKHGFKVVSVGGPSLWLDAPDARGITFAKKIT
ncbi:MAG: GNAT family N-acetyltransferase [Candidatus Helarchaeota archaeon]